jgi:hypothetical protein
VKLLDANILLYAYDSDSAHHSVCVLGWKPPLIRNRSSRCHGKHCSPSYGSPQILARSRSPY